MFTRILCRLLTLLLASYFFCLLGNRITNPRANANETFGSVAAEIGSDVDEGTLFLNGRSAESFKGPSNLPKVADKPIGSASNVSEFERRVLDLLAAGRQAEAEALLQEDVARTPTIQNVITLLDQGKPAEAAQIFNAHTNEFQQAKRTLFLYGACLRSRFEIFTCATCFC